LLTASSEIWLFPLLANKYSLFFFLKVERYVFNWFMVSLLARAKIVLFIHISESLTNSFEASRKLWCSALLDKKVQIECNVFISPFKRLLKGKWGGVISAHLLVIPLYFPFFCYISFICFPHFSQKTASLGFSAPQYLQ
jgi:hypothetical protein